MLRSAKRLLLVVVGVAILAAACSSAESARPDPESVYNPVFEGEETPDGFRQLLNRDDIFPVYDPTFVRSDQVDWPEEGLVVGVDLEGEARAYPVGFMTRREMVIDNHRGIPTLVTW